ncbi:hypothetical protein V6N11_051444 [Hibiscus sabdariffa]|uniref:Uncharacterized protein n=1 Tax=Hibiscus sabdariffa TaxID=183260 RepID=A0ABR2U7F9_9ROSI
MTTLQIPKENTEGKEVEALPPSKQQEEIQRKVSPIAKETGEEKDGFREIRHRMLRLLSSRDNEENGWLKTENQHEK